MDNTAEIKKPTIEEYFGIPEIPDTTSVDLKQIIGTIIKNRKKASEYEYLCRTSGDECGHMDVFDDIRFDLAGAGDDLKQISNEIDELREIANQWKGIAQRFVDIYGSLREDEENEDED